MTQREHLISILHAFAVYHARIREQIELGGPFARVLARATIAMPEYNQMVQAVNAASPKTPKKRTHV